jgi:ribosome recycling factor
MKEVIQNSRQKMDKSLLHFKDNLAGLHGGNTISVIEAVRVRFKGTVEPLGRVAMVLPQLHNNVQIRPHDPEALPDVRRALEGQGYSVYQPGKEDVVYVSQPRMDSGQKEKLVAQIRGLAEDARVTIRNIRHDAKKGQQKAKKRLDPKALMSEDAERRLDKELLALVESFIKQIDTIMEKKIQLVNS